MKGIEIIARIVSLLVIIVIISYTIIDFFIASGSTAPEYKDTLVTISIVGKIFTAIFALILFTDRDEKCDNNKK